MGMSLFFTLSGYLIVSTLRSATIPEFIWELSLGIYLMVKGFKPSPITEALPAEATV